jgi:hypothetical protein
MRTPPLSRAAVAKLAPMRHGMARFLAARGWSREAPLRRGGTMQWKFFLGASLLTGALLLPHARLVPVLAGIVLAGLIQLAWARISGR